MNTIHKFEVPVDDQRHAIQLSLPGHITRVEALKPDVVTFWALVNTEAAHEERYFTVVGTGHPIPIDTASVWGTAPASMLGGPLVWHLIETSFASDPTKEERA